MDPAGRTKGQNIDMVKPIVKDIFLLGQKSEPATKADLAVANDTLPLTIVY